MIKENLKVLFVIDTLYNAGAEKSLLEIASNFYEITPIFVHIYKENSLKNEFLQEGIKVYSLGIPGEWNLKLAQEKLKVIYEKERPDIVHATLFRSELVTRRLKKLFPNIHLINSLVNDSYNPIKLRDESLIRKIKGKIIQYIDASTAKKVDFFISNSETIKRKKANDLKISRNKIKVIYRGRNLNKFKLIKKEKVEELLENYQLYDKKILLNVGRLIDSKGQKDIIAIMPEILVHHPNTVFLIAGEGNKREALENQIVNLNLEKNVYLLGNCNCIPELLALSHVFVFPTYMEGLPGSLIEAMFSKTLICCSDISVNLECVSHESAVIFKVGNSKDIFNKINFSLANFQKLQKKSIQAYKEASEKFDVREIAKQYQDFYQSLY